MQHGAQLVKPVGAQIPANRYRKRRKAHGFDMRQDLPSCRTNALQYVARALPLPVVDAVKLSRGRRDV